MVKYFKQAVVGMKIKKGLIVPLIITGIFLGIYPIVQTHVPAHVATWSGMWLLGNHFGYTLAALIFAYLNDNRWKSNFLTALLLITIASIVYYLGIGILDAVGFLPYGSPSLFVQLTSFVAWSIVGAVLSALIATAVQLIRHGRRRWLRICAHIATYFALLWVIYEFYVKFIIRAYFNHFNHEHLPYRYIHVGFLGRVFSGDVFWSIAGFLICTVLLILVWKKEQPAKRDVPGPHLTE